MIAEEGAAIDPDAVEARLRDDSARAIKAVLMVQTDTASSARNDVAAVRRALDAADHPALLMVDCIASMACERFEMDAWGVDVTLAASQKGLMTPPGLGFVWAGPRALAAHRTADMRTRYWDWTFRLQEGPQYLRFCGTAPVSHIFGFREALRMIDEEGLEARWQRHTALASAVRAAVDAWSAPDGLSLFVRDPAHRGDSVTTIAHRWRRLRRGSPTIARDGGGVTLGVGLLASRRSRVPHRPHGPRQRGVDPRRARCRRSGAAGDRRADRRIGCRRRRGSRSRVDRTVDVTESAISSVRAAATVGCDLLALLQCDAGEHGEHADDVER